MWFSCLSTGKLSDDACEDGSTGSLAPRLFKSKLEDAITMKQESEAKVATLEEKVKRYEVEIAELKQRVRICWFDSFKSSLK